MKLLFLISVLWCSFVNAQNPIYSEGGELSRYFPKSGTFPNRIDGIENCNGSDTAKGTAFDFTLSRTFDTVYDGNAAMRFEVRNCYALPYTNGDDIAFPEYLVGGSQRVRSEVRIIDTDVNTNYTNEIWYSEVLYFPANGMVQDSLADITINQWFIDGGNDCVLRMKNGRMWFELLANKLDLFGAINAAPVTGETTAANTFVKYTPDTWYTFVFHFIHSTGSDGLLEIWRDGVKIQTRNGPTMHTTGGIRWKIGIYAADFTEHPERSIATKKIFFIDNIRVGDENAVYADMVSTPPVGNVAPIAAAGADQTITLPTSSVSLSGSGSTDSDGTIVSYAWTKVSGVGGTITSPSSSSTTVTGLTTGPYVFRLTVTDDDGDTDIDDVNITVLPEPNAAPVANAGSDQTITLPTSSVTLNGSSSTDSDGTITTYAWTKISGTGSTIASPSSASTNITGLTAGSYTFRLTVTDDDGATSTDNVSVTVLPALNVLPTANAGADQTITLPTSTATFAGSGNDADGSIVSYLWTKISGPAGGTITTPTSATSGVTALQEGTYSFRLTVTDNSGATATDLMQIIVNPAIPPANIPPVSIAGSDQVIQLPTNAATLTGSGTDADGTIISYWWDKLSGPTGGGIVTPALASTGLIALTAGTYVYQLTVTDNGGATATDNVQIIVLAAANVPPTANAGSNITITLPTSSVTLTAIASTDSDGTIVSYLWQKISGPNGGTIASPNSLTTTINSLQKGTYNFTLTVTDDDGATGTTTIQIIVNKAPRRISQIIGTRKRYKASNIRNGVFY